ncbi:MULTISPECIES: C69 family dipeptidase [Pacificimonas]|uniref:C69 family dipeptidase n=1 Tax=Pacificimonas TaxID=1960290 RepID=UPI001CCBD1F4|nr:MULTISPECIES: C69 family dipeptidase [Pacificimonas]
MPSLLRAASTALACAALVTAAAAQASYAFYVGRDLTDDGSVLVGGTGEEVSSHWLEIVPARSHPSGATIKVGVTAEAVIPGELIEIPQVPHTFRYMHMAYTDFEGFPPPLTNGGVNEHQVAVRDVWAPSRRELVEMTPRPQRGLQYSDLARIVMERARTAREGVEIIGELIARHGFATYGGNTHLIADPNEGWVVWEFAGGQGLWVAERLHEDDVRVLYPGGIGDIPTDLASDSDFLASDNFISFAVERGWFDPASGESFNVQHVYGDQSIRDYREPGIKLMSPAAMEAATRAMAPVSESDLMQRVRDPRVVDDDSGYGQVVSLRKDLPDADLIRVWNAPTGSVAAPFNVWWLGVEKVPMEYAQHRYLTKDSAATFLNPDYQIQEATRFAGRTFKRVMYFACSDPDRLLGPVTEMLTGFERETQADLSWVEHMAGTMIDGGDRGAARELLTHFAGTRAIAALDLGDTIAEALDAYIRLVGGRRAPDGGRINTLDPTVNCLANGDPDHAE